MIAPKILMTAAHCLATMDPVAWKVTTYRLTLNGDTASDLVYSVKKIYRHPNYDSGSEQNDVALFILEDPQTNDGTYTPSFIELNRNSSVPAEGATLKAIGWGTTSSGGSVSNTLLEVDLPFVNASQCQASGYNGAVAYPSMICAGVAGKDTCQGDSGGPLFYKGGNGKFYQVGITSWGYGCGTYPGVYSKISYLYPWIDDIVDSEGGYANGGSTRTTKTKTTLTTTTTVTPTYLSYCATPNVVIPDQDSVTSDLEVPDGYGDATNIRVQVKFNHTYPRDLSGTITRLTDNVEVSLFSRIFCTTPKTVTATFDDDGTSQFYDCINQPSSVTLQPNGTLRGVYAGALASGNWRLMVKDNVAADSGFLYEWCLLVDALPQGTTVSCDRSIFG